eukprot:m.269198 g.269198  ORF g.269198 m.269198 type:complete len:444 (-) comp82937_c0_seq1:156-1487(-)
MEFSDVFKQSGCCLFSPDAQYIAFVVDHRLIIRSAEDLRVIQLHQCLDKISFIEWSSDSLYILCAQLKRGLVEVWSLEQPEWTCKVDEGSAGLTHARWSPDGRHVLTSADFQLRITVWSLINNQVNFLKFPKYAKKGCAFSNDGLYMAVLERSDCKDFVGVFACKTWEMVQRFQVATTDATDLMWSGDDRTICVWDYLVCYKVCIYTLSGRCLHEYSAYSDALGVKSLQWSPSGQILAIGSYDQKLRLLNTLTWGEISTSEHGDSVDDKRVVVYREVEAKAVSEKIDSGFNSDGNATSSRYEIQKTPFQLETTKPDPEKPFPKLGVGVIEFSPDSRFYATRNDNMSSAVWIWDVSKLRQVALLRHISGVRAMKWHPTRVLLAMATGSGMVYFWSPNGCLCAQIPADRTFSVLDFYWSSEGKSILLLDKNRFCVAFTSSGLEAL